MLGTFSLSRRRLRILFVLIMGFSLASMLFVVMNLEVEIQPPTLTNTRKIYFSQAPLAENDTDTCENTKQGKILVADDKGMVCPRKHLNVSSGCCLPWHNQTKIYTCDGCLSSFHCCLDYEYCVSCCLSKNIENQLEDGFHHCKAVCRTNSRSVVHENEFRSPFKHCFGTSSPPFIQKLDETH
mmetsp:Transcript_18250/g.25556  ORF Transcript_18250/g.25556 Transcript_18250/m.25556 type:complete len:183 (-) Transcript_18250:55-603(-)